MKKVFYYISIFIIFCFLGDFAINYSIAKQIDDQSPYCLSFASIGANLLESRLDSWAKIKPIKTFQEMDQELAEILIMLNLPVRKTNFQHLDLEKKKTLRYEIVYNAQYYLFTLQTDAQDTYFILTSTSSKDDKQLRQIEKILHNKLQCKSYFQFKGLVASYLNAEFREKYANSLLKSLNAKQMDCYEDNYLISMSAYSPDLKKETETIEAAGKQYNLQMVLRSDPQTNQTYVYLGFPLLLNDY